jgi:hypothetical protein
MAALFVALLILAPPASATSTWTMVSARLLLATTAILPILWELAEPALLALITELLIIPAMTAASFLTA